MTTVVVAPFDVVSFPDGAGHFWVYMQYVQGLQRLGCDVYEPEGWRTEKFGRSTVPGLYVIGDASRDVMQAVVAAGEGAVAAAAVNTDLLHEEFC